MRVGNSSALSHMDFSASAKQTADSSFEIPRRAGNSTIKKLRGDR